MPYVPKELRTPVLTAFHDHLGHVGAKHMAGVLARRFYWPRMYQDAFAYCTECHEGTLAKPPMRRPRRPKGPELGTYPFDVLYCDILSMAPTHDYVKGGAGYDKLLIYVDSLTRWVEAMPFNGDPTSEQGLDADLVRVRGQRPDQLGAGHSAPPVRARGHATANTTITSDFAVGGGPKL